MTRLTEIDTTLDLEQEIKSLKEKHNAVILAHYYQSPEIQDAADFVGDSLELSQKAASTDADVIVIAGVHCMAETAKILSPNKKVLLPDLNARCSLSEGCPAPLVKGFREEFSDHVVISHIDCSASVKALSDIICTSSNAVKIVSQIPPEQKIIFAPDRNLGRFIMKQTGRDMLLWNGSCIVHETFSDKKIIQLKLENPDSLLIAHPSCEEVILSKAEFIGSASGLLKFVQESDKDEFIVANEAGIIHQMKLKCPDKKLIPAPPNADYTTNECPYMKLNTMQKIYLCLRDQTPEIILDEEIRLRALKPLQKMLEMS